MKTWDTLSICDLQIVDIYQNKAPQNTGDIVHMLVVPMDPQGHVEH